MFWKKTKTREQSYLELNEKFKDKHGIVANWYMKKHLCNNNGLLPINEEGLSYQRRMVDFFGDNKYGKLPYSYSLIPYLNQGNIKNFDYFPIEKLLELYNQIEEFFPEPFKK